MSRVLAVCLCSILLLSSGFARAAETSGKDRLGRVVSDATLTDYRGASVSLAELKDKPVIVLAFLGLSLSWQ